MHKEVIDLTGVNDPRQKRDATHLSETAHGMIKNDIAISFSRLLYFPTPLRTDSTRKNSTKKRR